MSDDSTRTGFGAGYGADDTRTITSRKIQVRMPSGKIYGPYTRLEVLNFITEKRVQGEEFILVEGETDWRPITSDTEFFDALQAAIFGAAKKEKKKGPGFTENENRTAATKNKVDSKSASAKTDTRLTSFGEKSAPSVPSQVSLTNKPKENTQAPVTRPSAGQAGGGTPETAKIENNTQTAWAQPATTSGIGVRPPLPTGTGGKPARNAKRPLVLAFAIAAALGGAYVYLDGGRADLTAARSFGMFQGKLWYSRPLQLVMEGLQIQAQPMPAVIEASEDWELVEDFGAQAWADDLKKLIATEDASYRVKSAYWGRWAWNTLWLGSVIRVFDTKLGNSLFRDGLQIYQELLNRKLVPASQQAMFEGATLFIEGKFKEAAAKMAGVSDVELAQWLAEESAWQAFWQAGARGAGYRRLRDEYRSPALDLSSRVRAAFMTRESQDFNESLLQLSNQSPLLNTLWFGAAQGNWRLRKDGTAFANKMFLTGLGAVALNPGSVQAVYWAQFAEFLGVFGRQATSNKARANLAALTSGDIERAAAKGEWWDLNAAELDVSSLAEEVLGKSAKGMLNPRDMATLYVLGFVAPNGSKYLTVAAQHWAFEGKWGKAYELFNRIVKIDPKSIEALSGVVWSAANLYRFGEAFDAHDRVPATGARTPEATKLMGVIQSVGREYDNAEQSFNEYLKSVPNDGWGHYFLAENYTHLERNVDCVKSANLARIHATGELKLRANLLFYRCRVLAKMDVKNALADLEALAKNNPDSVPIALEYIRALRNADLFDQALEFNRQMLTRYSRSFELRMMLGQLYESKNDFDRAVAFYSRAHKDQPELAEPIVRTGKIYESQKKWVMAAQNFETASRIQPEYPEVWLLAARAYRQARQPDVAARMYFQEIEERPAVIASFIEAAEFFLEINAPQEVPKLFQKFQDDFQDDPRVKTRLAQAYLAMNDLDKAQESAAAAMAANNKIPETYRVLGYVYDQQAQYDEAAKYFNTYLELLPQAADADAIRAKISVSPYR